MCPYPIGPARQLPTITLGNFPRPYSESEWNAPWYATDVKWVCPEPHLYIYAQCIHTHTRSSMYIRARLYTCVSAGMCGCRQVGGKELLFGWPSSIEVGQSSKPICPSSLGWIILSHIPRRHFSTRYREKERRKGPSTHYIGDISLYILTCPHHNHLLAT